MHEMHLATVSVTWHRLQVDEMKDKLLRTLADMENLRDRTERQIAANKQFAIQVCHLSNAHLILGLPYHDKYSTAPHLVHISI